MLQAVEETRDQLKSSLEIDRETVWTKRHLGTKPFQCHCGQWCCLKHSVGYENDASVEKKQEEARLFACEQTIVSIHFRGRESTIDTLALENYRLRDADGVAYVELHYEDGSVHRFESMQLSDVT